jgi:F0F1-type ATP synthase alpha subunit
MKYTFKTTLEYYRKSRPLSLKSNIDLDWASSKECKSTSRMVHLLNDSIIAWSSKKQTIIALSIEKAEYIAASECTRKVVYLRQLLSELSYPQHTPTHIHEDNQTCILFTRDNTTHSHTKYINVKYHFTRFQIDESAITLIDTRMENQLVDLFMKQQTVKRHTEDCKQLGLDLE